MTTNPTTYEVEVWNCEEDFLVETKTFETEVEALQYITVSIDEDMEYGDYETYEYFLNDELIC